MGTLKL